MSVHTLYKLLPAMLILLCIASAGCLEMTNPTPDHAMVHGNVIYLDPDYMDRQFIWGLLLDPNGYDTALVAEVDNWLNPDNPVIELGAGVGVLSSYINERVTLPAQQVSVEPNPYLLPSLIKTKTENMLNFMILPKAVSYERSENVTISVDSSILQNRIIEGSSYVNTVEVPAITIEEIANNAGFNKNITLIMNIVGYEHEVIQHEPEFLQSSVGMVIAAVHDDGRNTPDTFVSRMQHLGFTERERIFDPNGNYLAIVFENTGMIADEPEAVSEPVTE